jgi:hypothetical protein
MKITQSPVKRLGTAYEQEISYEVGPKRRREIYCQWTEEALRQRTQTGEAFMIVIIVGLLFVAWLVAVMFVTRKNK